MDALSGVSPNTLAQALTIPRTSPKAPEAQGFQIEAATLDISVKLNYVQLTGGGADQATNVQELLDKVKQWVHDIFDKNGVEWKDRSPEEAQKQVDDGGEQSPD